MPYYSDLGLSGIPSSSAYSSLFLSGPYSNHSSIIASNFSTPKSIPRQYRGVYKPHLSTITELNTPLRRIGTPKLLYQGTPTTVRPIKKINTADIDVSVNKYKKFDKYDRSKPEIVEKKTPDKSPSPIRSPRQSVEEKDQKTAKPNSNIRRERPTIRLQTLHKDTLQKEIGEIRSWRDNFKPEELSYEAKRVKKTPGEILKEKFLIRSRSKENILKPETKKVSRKNSIRKSPSFQEICEAITSDNVELDLNPGQPEEVQRRQSRQISSENILKQIRRSSTDLSEEDLKILDAILSEQSAMPTVEKKERESFNLRSSVRKKKSKKSDDEDERSEPFRVKKSHSNEKITETEVKSPLQRHPVKKRPRTPSAEKEEKTDDLKEDIYQNVIRDISQVEIEQTAFKPKPVISGSGEIGQSKTSLKAVVDDVEVQETSKPKKDKKFRFNVIVEVEDEDNSERRSVTPEENKSRTKQKAPKVLPGIKMIVTDDHKGTVQYPKPKEHIVSSILGKMSPVHKGRVIEEKIKKLVEKREAVITSFEDDLLPTSPVIKEKSMYNNVLKEENASDLNLFENKSLPGTPINKVNLSDTSTPSSPLTSKRNIFSRENSNNGDSWPSSPGIFNNKVQNVNNSSAPASPFGSKSNLFNGDNSRPSSPSISANKMKILDSSTPPSSPLAGRRNIFSRDNSKNEEVSNSRPDTPKNKNFDNTSAPASPFANKLNFFSRGNSEKEDTPPSSPSTFLNEKLDSVSTPLSPTKNNIFSRDSSKKEETPPSSPLLNKEGREKFGTPPSSVLKKSNYIVNKAEVETQVSQNISSNQDVSLQSAKTVNGGIIKGDESAISPIGEKEKEEVSYKVETKTGDSKEALNNSIVTEEEIKKDENDNNISNHIDLEKETAEIKEEKCEVVKKLVSKRSLVQKANKDDPDLMVFIPPEPEPEPEPMEEKKDVFVPLQSNRLSQWMHPWKKPAQLDVCPVEIYARPKFIRGRHYPRPRGNPAPPAPQNDESSSEEEDDEEEETEEDTSSEEETTEDECEESMATKIGASTSSNDSGFGSGAPGKNKG